VMVVRGEVIRRLGRENGLGIVTPHLVKLIPNNDLHDFRWDIVLKLLKPSRERLERFSIRHIVYYSNASHTCGERHAPQARTVIPVSERRRVEAVAR
jgi:hypothetical protein